MATKYVYQMATEYTKWPQNRPNIHTIYQHVPLQDPRKFTQIGTFCLENIRSGNPASSPCRNYFLSETFVQI
jgi:hypothetical protein